MNPTKVSKRTRKDSTIWRRLLAEKEQSTLSVRAFCQDKGITEASYYSWRKRLGSIPVKDESFFSPIEIQAKAGTGAVVELPGGVTVRFGGLPPVEYLHHLSITFSRG